MSADLQQILNDRKEKYGDFKSQSHLSQELKHAINLHVNERVKRERVIHYFSPMQSEALDMIFNKIARIANGDPNYADSWRDIAGYALLVAENLDK